MNGTIGAAGCSSVSAYGIYYSEAPGFADGAGTQVSGSNLSGTGFSVNISGLSPNTVYYFKVYASNSGGTSYSAQASFTTANLAAPAATAGTAVTSTSFTANWGSVTGATGYQLDVSTSATFGTSSSGTIVGWDFQGSSTTANSGVAANNTKVITTTAGNPVGTITFATVSSSNTARADNWNSGSGTKYWEALAFSTTGYAGITVSSKQRSSSTGPRDFKLQYKVGSGTYIDVINGTVTTGDNLTTGVLNAIALPAACDNQSSVSLRWIMTSNTSVGNGTVAATGASNLDEIIVVGTTYNPSFVVNYYALPVAGTTQSVTELTPNTTYYYRVRATSSNSTSVNSAVQSVTTGTAAPTGNASQTFCGSATVADLVATGSNVQWYAAATGGSVLATSFPLVTGTHYYASQTVNSTESVDRFDVTATVNLMIFSGSGNWTSTTNWSCNRIPVTADKILIATGANPLLDIDFTVGSFGSLTLATGCGFTIAPTNTLTIAGTADFNGQPVTFKSDETGSALLGTITGNVVGDNNVTVERFITAKRAWRMLATPLSSAGNIFSTWQNSKVYTPGIGAFITGVSSDYEASGLDASAQNSSTLYRYNNATNSFEIVNNTKTNSLDRPYMIFVRGDRDPVNFTPGNTSTTILKATGTLNKFSQQVSTTAGANKFTLVSNPYVSPIDFNKIFTANASAGIQQRFWIWDPNLNATGGFITVSYDGVSGYNIVPRSAQTQHIQTGQAFFIKNKGTTTSSNTLIFTEDHKSATNTPAVFREGAQLEKMSIELHTSGTTSILVDGVLANYHNSYSPSVSEEDASKLTGFDENVNIKRGTRALSIEGRPLIEEKDTTFLAFTNMKQKEYQLRLNASGFNAPGLTAVLIDKYLQSTTHVDLNGSTTYTFTVTSAPKSVTERFTIVYRATGTLPLTLTSITAIEQAGNVQVEWKVENETDISSYSVERSLNALMFETVGSVPASNAGIAKYASSDKVPFSGVSYYRIKITTKTGEVRYSPVVKVTVMKGKPIYSIYPNPVVTNSFQLTLRNVEAGMYTLNLFNKSGQKLVSSS